MNKYVYPAEKLAAARKKLMLPHPQGQDQSIRDALHECRIGLYDISPDDLDDSARAWLNRLKEFMDDWDAEDMGDDELAELSRIVDELAHRFDDRAR